MVLSSSSVCCKDIFVLSYLSTDLPQVILCLNSIRNRLAARYLDLQREEIVAGIHEGLDLLQAHPFAFKVRQDPEIEVVHRQPRRTRHRPEQLQHHFTTLFPIHRVVAPLVTEAVDVMNIFALRVDRRARVVVPDLTAEERWPSILQ